MMYISSVVNVQQELTMALPTCIPFDAMVTLASEVTGYGYPDNDPPGRAIAFPQGTSVPSPGIGTHPTLHTQAGGLGTWLDPLTFAADPRIFAPGTRIFDPFTKCYYIMEDTCADCIALYDSGIVRVDLWVGGTGTAAPTSKINNTAAYISAVAGSTPADRNIIVNPNRSLHNVNTDLPPNPTGTGGELWRKYFP